MRERRLPGLEGPVLRQEVDKVTKPGRSPSTCLGVPEDPACNHLYLVLSTLKTPPPYSTLASRPFVLLQVSEQVLLLLEAWVKSSALL